MPSVAARRAFVSFVGFFFVRRFPLPLCNLSSARTAHSLLFLLCFPLFAFLLALRTAAGVCWFRDGRFKRLARSGIHASFLRIHLEVAHKIIRSRNPVALVDLLARFFLVFVLIFLSSLQTWPHRFVFSHLGFFLGFRPLPSRLSDVTIESQKVRRTSSRRERRITTERMRFGSLVAGGRQSGRA